MKTAFIMLFILMTLMFSSNCYSEELALFDTNSSAKVYLIKQSLVQESEFIRTVWIKYDYTKAGSIDLKRDFKLVRLPKYSKVKYGFDCSSTKGGTP